MFLYLADPLPSDQSPGYYCESFISINIGLIELSNTGTVL